MSFRPPFRKLRAASTNLGELRLNETGRKLTGVDAGYMRAIAEVLLEENPGFVVSHREQQLANMLLDVLDATNETSLDNSLYDMYSHLAEFPKNEVDKTPSV